LALVVLVFIGRRLVQQWEATRGQPLTLHLRWSYVVLSAATVLAAYTLLIQTWRAILGTWGTRLGFWPAARVWLVSSLFRYIPGALWQVPAMGLMAKEAGTSSVAAAGSAVLSTIASIACGIAVALVASWSQIDALAGGHAIIGVLVGVLVGACLVLLPVLMPYAVRLAERATGRTFGIGNIPSIAVAYAIMGNTLAWVLYGLAFRWLVVGVIGDAPGRIASYLAVYAASYVIGFIAVVAPAGLGVRDVAMTTALTSLGLLPVKAAGVVALSSRLLLTILEIAPGLLFGAGAAFAARNRISPED